MLQFGLIEFIVLMSRTESEDCVQLLTPKTPRHRNVLSERVPVTPRHKIGVVKNPRLPLTPRTPSTPNKIPTVYDCARQLFDRNCDPGPLIGREHERRQLHIALKEGIQSKVGRCLYVSGPPGTGKSALVNDVCRSVKDSENVKSAFINCMSVNSSKDIYGKLVEELVGSDVETGDWTAQLRATFVPKIPSSKLVYIVTLDEIDSLLNLDLEFLYTLFEWSLHRQSRLIVIGIANALDLTDRFLPRLKLKNLKPQLVPFLPYTAPQIASVVTTKLKSLSPTGSTTPANYVPFIHPSAIQLCSKKVAAQSGDLRKAFDIVRRAIDLIATETKKKHENDLEAQPILVSPSRPPLGENPNLRVPPRAAMDLKTSLSSLTILNAPRATIAHISRVSAAAFSNGTSQRLQTLNLQQKAALCALISHQRQHRNNASSIFANTFKAYTPPSVRKVFETYSELCKRENSLHPLTSTEFVDIISGLETLGLAGEEKDVTRSGAASATPRRKGKRITGEKRIVCYVGEDEVKGCLYGAGSVILTGLLRDDLERLD